MNNKDFISVLSHRTNLTVRETQSLVSDVISVLSENLEDENTISVPSFGIFEVKKKMERVVVNPTTKQRMLVPPKLVVNFRSSTTLKEKIQ